MIELEVITKEGAGRLDKYLSEACPEHSRSFFKKLCEDGRVTSDGKVLDAKYKPRDGERIVCILDDPKPIDAQPENIPIDIVYEDGDIIVVNKHKGLVTHPAPGNESGTLVNALLFHADSLSGINGELRPGIVHRLDKYTTGLIVVAKNDAAHNSLAEQIAEKTASREYLAIINGHMKEKEGSICQPIARHRTDRKRMAVDRNGREALTFYDVVEEYPAYSLVHVALKTGRTHQIRVHFAWMGHSVAGDDVYGRVPCKFETSGQALHAVRLTLTHPRTGERMAFYAQPPKYFKDMLETLGSDLTCLEKYRENAISN